jgi:hypothetical protein
MSIPTTVTLDDDVVERVNQEARGRGASFGETLNDVVRRGLLAPQHHSGQRTLKIEPILSGLHPGLDISDIEGLIEFAEGPLHR